MRIGIITLPLHTNYGGLLQAYALKTALETLGHDAVVLDLEDKMPGPSVLKAPFVYAGRLLRRITEGAHGPEVFREWRYRKELPVVGANTSRFVDTFISPRLLTAYSKIKEGEFDAFVVGSDQVWRPLYFPGIENAFLAFAEDWDIRRVAYAASFGTEQLEFGYDRLEACAKLLRKFDGVSVREDRGVQMCSEWFDYEDAVHVLDPVMLLDAEHYLKMSELSQEHPAEGKIVTYILDGSDRKQSVADFIARVSGMEVHDVSVRPYDRRLPLGERVVPPVEKWLAAFADADFVITDSFHGCVLSILLHKRFIALGNTRRGISRFQSLLDMFGLDMRLVHGIDPEDDGEFFLSEPDWARIDLKLQQMRDISYEFLRDKLWIR